MNSKSKNTKNISENANEALAINATKSDCIATVSSEALFNHKDALKIQHQNDVYILRITKQNKLILTK